MPSIPKVFLLHGFLGAGKTTLARRLEGQHRALRFTHDEWMVRLYGHDPHEAEFGEYARRVSGLIEEMWVRSLDLGTSVILDSGFWSRAERDRVRDLVAARGGQPVLYRLHCPDEVAWARIERRNAHLSGDLFIARATFESLKARFEPLDPEEDRIEIDSGDDS